MCGNDRIVQMNINKIKLILFIAVFSITALVCKSQTLDQFNLSISKEAVISDLDSMYMLLVKKHINPFWKNSPSQYFAAYQKIRRSIQLYKEPLTIESSFLFFQRLLSYTGNIHDNAYLLGNNAISRYFPIYLKRFTTGNGTELRVTIADSGLSDILGAKILKIEGFSIGAVIEKIRSILPENSSHAEYYLTRFALKNASVLHLLGIIKDASYCDFTFLDKNNSVVIKRIPSYDLTTINSKINLNFYDDLMRTMPLTRQKRNLNYWFEYFPEKRTVYFRYRAVSRNDDESPIQFSKRLFRFIDSTNTQKLIIDVRDNIGGDSFLNQPFIADLQNSSLSKSAGSIVCIVNALTFSAAINFFQQVAQKAQGVIIGEATADAPNFCSDFVLDSLPNTKYKVPLSTICLLNSYEYDARKNYVPDVLLKDFTWQEYISNKDRMLHFAFNYEVPTRKQFQTKALDKAVGKYQYNAVKPAYIKKQNGQYWFSIPGEIATPLFLQNGNTYKGTNNMRFIIHGNTITLLSNSNKKVLSRLPSEKITPYELAETDQLGLATKAFNEEKQRNPTVLFLQDANMSLFAYQLYFFKRNKALSMALLEISNTINPGSLFSKNTKALINEADKAVTNDN